MELIINRFNINEYRQGTFPATSIKWEAGKLDKNVLGNFPNLVKLDCSNNKLITLEGLENCIQLQELDCSRNRLTGIRELGWCAQLQKINCSFNQLTDLRGLEYCAQLQELHCFCNPQVSFQWLKYCTQLQKLDCSATQLTDLKGIENFTQLQEFRCSLNQMRDLRGLENCLQLRRLDCAHNRLTDLRELEFCTQLQILECGGNNLTTLQSLVNCVQLQKLYCECNSLVNLRGLENLVQLQRLRCCFNKLINLQGLENCVQLQELQCFGNQIADLLPIVYLNQLVLLIARNNPLSPPTIQEERFLNRLNTTKTTNTIYTDRQNVHNTTIQKSVLNSTTNLLKDPKPPKPDITQLSIQTQTLLETYLQDKTPHSVLLITYEELFSYVWARIQKSPHKDTLIQILEQELKDSTNLCYTGRFNRTINTLGGFYDDIEVQISDPDRINAIIAKHKDKEKIIQALQEAGYDKQMIDDWTTDL